MGCFNFAQLRQTNVKIKKKSKYSRPHFSNPNKTNRDTYVIKITITYNIFYLDIWSFINTTFS